MSRPLTDTTAVEFVTGVLPIRPDVWKSRKPPMNATARIQNTNLAELRMVWSTWQNSFELQENRRGKLKKLPGNPGKNQVKEAFLMHWHSGRDTCGVSPKTRPPADRALD